jgi:hypothetical protein
VTVGGLTDYFWKVIKISVDRNLERRAVSDGSSTSSDEEQKRKEKIDRKQRKKREKEKLVQEVAQAAFAC